MLRAQLPDAPQDKEPTDRELSKGSESDLSIQFQANTVDTIIGSPFAIRFEWMNFGPNRAVNSKIQLALPEGVTVEPLPSNCTLTLDGLSCLTNIVKVGELYAMDLGLVASAHDTSGQRIITASIVNFLENDPKPSNNTSRMVLTTAPSLGSFDDLDDWTSPGGTTLNLDPNSTQGDHSVQPQGCNWISLRSTAVDSSLWARIGEKIALDVFVPSVVPNPNWVGEVQLIVDSISSGVHSDFQGQVSLTDLPRGAWSTVYFELTPTAITLFEGDNPAVTLQLNINTNLCGNNILLDNLRFTENLHARSVLHQDPGGGAIDSASFMTFDTPGDWNGHDFLEIVASPKSQGSGALRLESPGWTRIWSREFSTTELVGVSTDISLDIMVVAPPPNPYWVGDVQAYIDCPSAGIYSEYLGYRSLSNVFFDQFSALVFALPSHVQAVLNADHEGCRFMFDVGGSPMPEGFFLDNMGFVP